MPDRADRWTTDDVSVYLGYLSSNELAEGPKETVEKARRTTARTLSRWGVKARSRQPGRGGMNLYDPGEVRAARADRPGQGYRTDLNPTTETE